jgi:6-pyruvoyl-tetrahydropterin synthase
MFLNFIISICLKLKDEIQIEISFNNFMEEKSIVVIELNCLFFNIKKEVYDALDFYFIFSKNMKKKRIITCPWRWILHSRSYI